MFMKQSDRIVIAGWVYCSRQNGVVVDICGLSPCLGVGCHSGVETKILLKYESD